MNNNFSEYEENLYNDFQDFYDMYGDNFYDEEEAMDEYLDLLEEEGEFDYEDEDEDFEDEYYDEDEDEFYEDEEYSDLDMEFEQFYADTLDIYGNDVESAYNDFMVITDELYAEDASKPKGPSLYQKGKDWTTKQVDNIKGSTWKSGVAGAGVGAVAGLGGSALATSFGKDAAERKILKSKVKSGTATAADEARLKQLISKRRKAMALATAGGAVVGGAAGAGAQKLWGPKKATDATKEAAKEEVNKQSDFADAFADFYADNEYIYGDSEIGLEVALEDFMYAEDAAKPKGPGMFQKGKDFVKGEYNKTKTDWKRGAGYGAAAGLGLGLAGAAIANMTNKDKAEFKALKEKVANGTANAREVARFSELKSARTKRLMIGAAGGTAAGALAGAGASMYGKRKQDKAVSESAKAFGENSMLGTGLENDMSAAKKAIKGNNLQLGHQTKAEDNNASFLGNFNDQDRSYSAGDLVVDLLK